MNINGVIFDMDGLLIDTEKLYQKYWVSTANEKGFAMRPEHVLEIRSLPAKLAEKKLKALISNDFAYEEIKAQSKIYINNHIKEHGIEKKKGADELLEYLNKKRIKCAVATSTNPPFAKELLEKVNLLHWFDEFVSAHMVKNGKPNPDIYIEASKRLGLKAGECMALEDSPNGVLSAHRAGCVAVMVPDLSQPDEELAKLLYAKADDLIQVISLIETINA